MSKSSVVVNVGRRKLSLSNLNKPLYPGGFTKGQVIEYYAAIAPVMLPHLKDRPVTRKRCPDGVMKEIFYEKNCPSHRPDWIKTASVSRRGEEGPAYCLINGPADLVWLANLAALELHTPMAKASSPDRPTMMVFDLDPGAPAGQVDCLKLGLKLRDLLADLGLQSFAKTSGGKGVHIYIPLNGRSVTFDQTKSFARAIALMLEQQEPKKVTATMAKSGRVGKVFVDWSQNDRHKTTVCAYSMRARENPTISTPITWEEVKESTTSRKPTPLAFEADEVVARVRETGDLFEPVLTMKQPLPDVGAVA